MNIKERIELLKWLIGRSDSMRATYSKRAALILSAQAIILATTAFLLDKFITKAIYPWKAFFIIFVAASLILVAISFRLALRASISRKHSRESTRFEGPKRPFLNPRETFEAFESDVDNHTSKELEENFNKLTDKKFIESACAELSVDIQLQQSRYSKLKESVKYIEAAFLLLVATLIIALFQDIINKLSLALYNYITK